MSVGAPLIRGCLDPEAQSPFGAGSFIRQVLAEPVIFTLYPRALVMEVAHPSVAAAVADHSLFRTQPLRRLCATTDAGLRMFFGRQDEAMATAEHIYRLHDHIHGDAPAGPYTAHDATLLAWVWATLVDSAEVAFTRWVRPFDTSEAEVFYADMVAYGRFFGIPASLMPPTRAAFATYLDGVLAGDVLGTTATSARLVRQILWFQRWYTPAAAGRVVRLLTIGTLDPRLAERLDLTLSAEERRRFTRVDDALARRYPRVPAWRRQLPAAYLQLRRAVVSATAVAHRGPRAAASNATTSSSDTAEKSR